MKVVLFTPVRQDPETLDLVLKSHAQLDGLTDRWYYDDSDGPESSALLLGQHTLPALAIDREPYQVDGATHAWTNRLVSRIANIRNLGVQQFLASTADALFIVDSDLVLHPELIERLVSTDQPIISEVFWSQWRLGEPWLPNVWQYHPYSFSAANEILSKAPALDGNHHVWRVGGLGACTLIRREVFERGVRYEPIAGVNMWGEDRWFSIRAAVNGFPLHAETSLPPFHVYRKEQLREAQKWFDQGCDPAYFRREWLTEAWRAQIRAMFGEGNAQVA